jgi:hypothetical protein
MAVFPHLAALSSTPRLHGQYAIWVQANVILLTLPLPPNRLFLRRQIAANRKSSVTNRAAIARSIKFE